MKMLNTEDTIGDVPERDDIWLEHLRPDSRPTPREPDRARDVTSVVFLGGALVLGTPRRTTRGARDACAVVVDDIAGPQLSRRRTRSTGCGKERVSHRWPELKGFVP
jgi:hypothetical protein